MDEDELYCYDIASRRALHLLHFVRMLASPETEDTACYFYNRMEKGGARWVSYHFEKAAERVETDSSLVRIIEEVESDDD